MIHSYQLFPNPCGLTPSPGRQSLAGWGATVKWLCVEPPVRRKSAVLQRCSCVQMSSNRCRLQEFPDSSKSQPSSSPSCGAKGPSRPLMHHIANSRLINFFHRYVGLCPKCLCLSNLVTYSLSHHLSLVMLQNHARIGATKAKLWKPPPSWSMPPRAISHHCHRSGDRHLWRLDLQTRFEELSHTENAAIGPVLYVQVWYIHHARHVTCPIPKLVRLEDTPETWFADLVNAWREQVQMDEPLTIEVVTPSPPYSFQEHAEIHIMLEQQGGPDVVAFVFTAAFHGGHRLGLFQVAESMPNRICARTLIQKHNFQMFCDFRRATSSLAGCGLNTTSQKKFPPASVFLLDVGSVTDAASSTDAAVEAPDAMSLMQSGPSQATPTRASPARVQSHMPMRLQPREVIVVPNRSHLELQQRQQICPHQFSMVPAPNHKPTRIPWYLALAPAPAPTR